MQLISLSDFVLEKNEVGLFKKNDDQIRKYAEFLQQDLTLSMFLPCNEEGNVLSVPLKTDFLVEANEKCGGWDYIDFDNNDNRYYNKPLFKMAEHKYKKAVGNIVFTLVSFVNVKGQGDIKFYSVGNTQVFNLSDDGKHLYWHHYTIESLLSEMDETINFVGSF